MDPPGIKRPIQVLPPADFTVPAVGRYDLDKVQRKFGKTQSLARLIRAVANRGQMPAVRPWELHNRPHPIPNSYWVTTHLLACEYPWDPRIPSTLKLDALLDVGVRTFVDLTEEHELSPYAAQLLERAFLLKIDAKEIEYYRFPIHDRCCPESLDYMRRILDVLRDNEERNRTTAVHCRGGIGRTGVVVGCWLVECGIAKDGLEALEIIASEWHGVAKCTRYPQSPETGAQFNFVLNFHAGSPREQIVF